MKNRTFIILALLLMIIPARPSLAVERNFPAGSLIIPMDKTYQPDSDGGILEAYGVVFYLLNHTDEAGKHDISVYWVINQKKAAIDAADFIIEDLSLTTGKRVAGHYDHAGGTTDIIYRAGDNRKRLTYAGGPFIVDGADAHKAKTIIDQSNWSAVDIHVAEVPFKAPVYRKMRGTPPRIALMNNKEDDTGNASILESYLRLAGICTDIYDILTPNQIRDGILISEGYDFLWAPHWTGYSNNSDDDNGNGKPDVEDIVMEVRNFLGTGEGSLFAQCASIEVFEHSENGRFLSTKGFGHNQGTNDSDDIIYNDLAMPNSQVGDFEYAPEGGHLHNWRPFVIGDSYNFNDAPDETPEGDPSVTAGNPSVYNDSVTRFTIDNTGWDYYVGGYMDGDTNNGYVVYLGGHRYASCSGSVEVVTRADTHTMEFEFTEELSNEELTLLIRYNSGLQTTVTFNVDNSPFTAVSGDPLSVDLTTALRDGKKLVSVTFRNTGADTITIDSITISWTGGHSDQQFKKLTDNTDDITRYDKPEVLSGVQLNMTDFTIEAAENGAASCTNNDDCSWKNIAGVRYVLNTLFNMKFQLESSEYVRAAPIVSHPYLYQGSFQYPNYEGHFRSYTVTDSKADGDITANWDTAEKNHIRDPKTNNDEFLARKVYTSKKNGETWSRIDFDYNDPLDRDYLWRALDITPENGDDSDEEAVFKRLRGKVYNRRTGQWGARSNKLGAIMHSAPAIVSANSRTGMDRPEMAYVGDLYGMLHAIHTRADPSGSNNWSAGDEKWAYIPGNLLGKLKNDRTDANAPHNFAAVDGSPTVRDVYYDTTPDDEIDERQWRTILVCPEGFGGKYIFALDVTDPDAMSVLWEVTDPEMGHAFRAAIDRVKVTTGEEEEAEDVLKWVVFVATGFAEIAEEHGGISVFAFDLETGERIWKFSQPYADSVNDIPGAVTTFDTTGNGFSDRVYVGDMNGRMWELDAATGENPYGIDADERQIPLWNAGVGNPISVSPAIVRSGSNVILVFGTGGADWASNGDCKVKADCPPYAVYAVNATEMKPAESRTYAAGAGTLHWKFELNRGEKVWASPTIATNTVYVNTVTGSMESFDPKEDLNGDGRLLALYLAKGGTKNPSKDADNRIKWVIDDFGKSRGSLYVDRQHIYAATNDGRIVQIGGENFDPGGGVNVVLKSWQLR